MRAACPTLLLVEDDAGQALTLTGMLARDYWVQHVASKREALATLEVVQFDVVIWDLGLPDSGDDLDQRVGSLGQACALYPSARFVVLTGAVRVGLLNECLDVGAADYLRKPCTEDELLATLRVALSSHRASAIRDAIRSGGRLAIQRFRSAHGLQQHPVG